MMMIVVIPAFNEEQSVADVVRRLPRSLNGIEVVEAVVVDDGSTDATARYAEQAGAVVLSHPRRFGLASAFRTGLAYALHRGAGLIATLDADGQYRPEELELLLRTLIAEKADLVLGDRQVLTLTHMPAAYRVGNAVGSWMLRVLGLTSVHDASSGFRLFTRQFALMLRVTSEHTYTHEMLIQAGAAGARIAETDVTFLPRRYGKSKLVRTLRHHILRSCGTILRALFLYRPLRKFLALAFLCFMAALVITVPALSPLRVGSVVLGGIMAVLGLQFIVLGLLADAQAQQRSLHGSGQRPLP